MGQTDIQPRKQLDKIGIKVGIRVGSCELCAFKKDKPCDTCHREILSYIRAGTRESISY